MLVSRDFLKNIRGSTQLEAVMLWGPRQVGKTTLLSQLDPKSTLFLDDLALRQRAQSDPALVLDNAPLPCLIDEAQYAPHLFPEIKLRIDQRRRDNIKSDTNRNETMFYITGSNRLLLDKNVKESLAGRSSLHILHGFSVKEIFNHNPDVLLKDILYRGGFPDLYVRTELSVERYLNNYILSFIEKDIAQSAGINKLNEFHTVLRLLAARAGQFLQVAEVSKAAGVDKKTIDSWIYCLERNYIVKLVPTYSTNLSKRVVKMKKLFFYDTGLCARLQGFNNLESLWNSPSAGGLFESLVFSEIMKTEANFLKNWSLYTWRTKEKKEVDFILEHGEKVYLIEAKLAVHGARPFSLDSEIKKVFSKNFHKVVVTSGGKSENLGDKTRSVPISKLGSFLIEG